ncbi:TetR family transcriptional regulator [Virgibacillus halodenitrificans]|nr:TetR family transcriptional regulator [Virgibacillus halodenitrificans]
MDKAKQNRIIHAALQEFANKGFEQASTNQIVKHAQIGKGMLFYYFTNKQELYHYLAEYSLDLVMKEYLQQIDQTPPDFIERMKQAVQVKMRAFTENPHVFNFLGTILLAKEVHLSQKLERRMQELQELGNKIIYEGIDLTFFREDVDVDKAFKLLRWSIEGYQNELITQLSGKKLSELDMEPYWEEFYDYLEVLKTSFYKKQGE